MISQLHGTLLIKDLPTVVIDVAGVGYEVELSLTSFYALPECGHKVKLLTQLIVREDTQYLVGFLQASERRLFRELIRVSGVGPKLALAILSSIEPQVFIQCVLNSDTTRLTKLPGVGKKTAQRLLLDLHDRLLVQGESSSLQATTTASSDVPNTGVANVRQEALQALQALDFKASIAETMVQKVFEEGLSSQELIRRALQGVSTNS